MKNSQRMRPTVADFLVRAYLAPAETITIDDVSDQTWQASAG
jgi:hypothetical protein